jgi:hypothetical protein
LTRSGHSLTRLRMWKRGSPTKNLSIGETKGMTNLRLQSRTARNLFAEFVLIVLGISTALAADGWLEERKDRLKESGYLVRLAEDVESTLTQWERTERFHSVVYENGLAVLPYLRGDTMPTSDIQLLASLYIATRSARQLYVIDDTYAELSSIGELSLISNEAIRREFGSIVRLIERARLEGIVDRDNAAYRNTVRSLIPIELQMVIRGECELIASPLTCNIDADRELVKVTLTRILANTTLDLHLNLYLQTVVQEAGLVSRTMIRLRGLSELVQEEIRSREAAS